MANKKKSMSFGRWLALIIIVIAACAVIAIYLEKTQGSRAVAREDKGFIKALNAWVIENIEKDPVKTVVADRVTIFDAGIYFNPVYEEDALRVEYLETAVSLLGKDKNYREWAVRDAEYQLDEVFSFGLKTPLDSAKARVLDEYRMWCKIIADIPVSPDIENRLNDTLEEAKAKWAEASQMTGWKTTFIIDFGEKDGDIKVVMLSPVDEPYEYKLLNAEIVGKDEMKTAVAERKRNSR